jgi:hypothetical protein
MEKGASDKKSAHYLKDKREGFQESFAGYD